MTDEAKQNFENTNHALKLYNKTHRNQINCPLLDLNKPQFSDRLLQTECPTKTGTGDIIYGGVLAISLV